MRPALWVRRLWESISEPRHLKTFYLAVYVITLCVGTVTLVQPPASIQGPLGTFVAAFWASLITVGGAGGMVTVLPGWWWAEKASVLLCIAGSVIYEATALYLHVTGPPGAQRLTQSGYILLAIALFALRLVLTRRWDFEPRRG